MLKSKKGSKPSWLACQELRDSPALRFAKENKWIGLTSSWTSFGLALCHTFQSLSKCVFSLIEAM